MAETSRERLSRIKRIDQLIAYLRDELDWPIESDNIEEITYDYTPDELGIDSKNAAKIETIKQLMPLSTNQPWGIFFIKFEKKRLPVVALRRILSQLVIKKRASSKKSDKPSWRCNDLLFISSYGEEELRQISFAHFTENKEMGDLPTLKVLGWDGQDTNLHLDHVADELNTKLRWPDDERELEIWREQWTSAFTLRHQEVVTTSRELAVRLAELARGIRQRTNSVLEIEIETGPLRILMQGFKDALIHDLTEDHFADMYAQTIAYGLLSARVSRPAGLVADNIVDMVPITNPFLREMMETFLNIGGRKRKKRKGTFKGIDFDELGINDVVGLLRHANMEAVLRDFGNRNPQKDPVIHFYELFLKEYDSRMRTQRGIFYTPLPVVSFIVRSVDEILREKFGLKYGLADTITWEDMIKRNTEIKLPKYTKQEDHFVQILDPATGTGTFLVEVIDLIYNTMSSKWKTEDNSSKEITSLWNEYVPKHLLPRLYGFELLMAPYTIAHMKIGLKLTETGYRFESKQRAQIYLTNSLEPPQYRQLTFHSEILAHEAEAANQVKRKTHTTVVIGNPPYSNYSANLSPECRRIVDKYRNYNGIQIRERNQLQFERNIQDDYVKFIAMCENIISNLNYGVLGMITNATMLSSRSLRGMREHLCSVFDELYEVHLHGGSNEIFDGSHEDQNVFDIEHIVAIHIYHRFQGIGTKSIKLCEIKGSRLKKYQCLLESNVLSLPQLVIIPDKDNSAFVLSDAAHPEKLVSLDDVFIQYGAGIKTNRDNIVIGFEQVKLLNSVKEFKAELVALHNAKSYIKTILYRPFDERYIFYHKDAVKSRSYPTMQHMLYGPNIGIVASSTWTTPARFSLSVSDKMIEMKAGTHDRGTTFFPMYCYVIIYGKKRQVKVNFTDTFVDLWTKSVGLKFVDYGRGDLKNTCGPLDILYWICACCYSPTFRQRHLNELSHNFPVFPIPSSVAILKELVILATDIVALLLLQDNYPDASWNISANKISPFRELNTTFEAQKDITILSGYPKYKENKVFINSHTYFNNITEPIWNFYLGGYQVCQKWLKDRRGRILTKQDIDHYQKIVAAINDTIRLMAEIDKVIDKHGGWPNAFVTS